LLTGHGKGALGNFLYNLGQPRPDGRPPIFGESAKPEPDTQNPYCHVLSIENSPNASDVRKAMSFKILDTPGLNDIGGEKDLNHMINVLDMIGEQFHSLHSLVLVYRFMARMDAAIMSALRYYRDLFAPLFRAHNVILVLTGVSSDDYERHMQEGTWDSTVQSYLDSCNSVLELRMPGWNCPIDRCVFVNSKWRSGKITELLKNIPTKIKFENDELLYRSYCMREIILDHISTASEITLDTHLIPLPYPLETERVHALRVIDGRIQELLTTVAIENKLRATHLEQIDTLRTELTNIQTIIEQCVEEITRLSDTQKTPPTYIFGDDWIKFRKEGVYTTSTPCNKNSLCGGCGCDFKFEVHNASRTEYSRINDHYMVKVKPDFINIRVKDGSHWFYRFHLEYSGEKHNANTIRAQRKYKENHAKKHSKYTQDLLDKERALMGCENQLASHRSNLENLSADKDLLLPKVFKIEGICNVLACMKKYLACPVETSDPGRIHSAH
jgi:hypothetical protein